MVKDLASSQKIKEVKINWTEELKFYYKSKKTNKSYFKLMMKLKKKGILKNLKKRVIDSKLFKELHN